MWYFMKKQYTSLTLILCIFSFSLLLGGCFSVGENIDGIQLSNISYDHKIAGQDTGGNSFYSLTFSCKVKNTTDDDLQFEIVYSARYSGILGSPTSHSEIIVLQSDETKTLTYTHERCGDQVYSKSIEIYQVTKYVAE